MKYIRVIFSVCFFFAFAAGTAFFPLYAQEPALQEEDLQNETSEAVNATALNEAKDDPGAIFVIRSIDFDVKGRSRPFALIHNTELNTGEEIHGRENLEKYIQKKTQDLIN
ncbi:MAG: hypothetical protein LBN21_11870, partial [Treponema sp.]|nr:hypothetical protein [Treponema sp.]